MNYQNMTLREKVLQTFVVTIREVNTHGGPSEFFAKYPVGGLYYDYRQDSEGTVEMGTGTNPARLAQCRAASRTPLLVCADGCAMPGQRIIPSEAAIGSIQTEEAAYRYGQILGIQMNSNDIDWLLGPIVDLLYCREMPLFACSDDPVLASKLCCAVIRGVQSQGVCATAKHFPGLGTCNLNMHFGPGQNLLPFNAWMDSYGKIYQSAFAENVCSVMTTHITFPANQNEYEDGYYPIATFSHAITTSLLKEKLGFDGAVVTDALIMGGMTAGDLIEETVQAFRAGADLLLWPPVEAADRIVALLQSGQIPMSRLDDALARIDRMRTFRENSRNKATGFSLSDVEKTSRQLNAQAICLLRNQCNLLPLNQETVKRILIIDATDEGRDQTSPLLQSALMRCGFHVDVARHIYDVPSRVCWQSDIDKLQQQYDLIILNLDAEYATAWNEPFMLIWAFHLFSKQKKMVINYGSPFFADTYFPDDPTFIEVNGKPSPSTITSLVERMLGAAPFEGHRVLHSPPSIQP